MKVVKFGGSSLANAEQFKKVGDIIRADKTRRFVVPSAPGKRFPGDTKVTDLLYKMEAEAESGEDFSETFNEIKSRYAEIIEGLELSDFSLEEQFDEIEKRMKEDPDADYAASRGEHLNGRIMAAYLGFTFVDPFEMIFFDEEGMLDDRRTMKAVEKRLSGEEYAVIPGFYGCSHDGKVKAFSRGGSDITGSIVAGACHADVYENWTDVSGILMADPRIVENPAPISTITYAELQELAFMGASVLHEDSISPVKEKGIALNIRNTNRPQDPGTMIVEEVEEDGEQERFITGIAGRRNFTVLTIKKRPMNANEALRQALDILDRYHVAVEHITLGLDSFALVASTAALGDSVYDVIADMQKAIRPDDVNVKEGISLVATVGRKMTSRPGTSGRLFHALGKSGINIRTIAQGADELSIIVGVENADFEKAIKVLYERFAG